MKSQVENASVGSVGQGTNKLKHLFKYYGVFADTKNNLFFGLQKCYVGAIPYWGSFSSRLGFQH